MTIFVLCTHFSLAKEGEKYTASSLSGLADGVHLQAVSDQPAVKSKETSPKSAFRVLKDQYAARKFREGSISSVSDKFKRMVQRSQNGCVERIESRPHDCHGSDVLVHFCRDTSLVHCQSAIPCHGSKKCVPIKTYFASCNRTFVTGCRCDDTCQSKNDSRA